jgi:hypothetical protein
MACLLEPGRAGAGNLFEMNVAKLHVVLQTLCASVWRRRIVPPSEEMTSGYW